LVIHIAKILYYSRNLKRVFTSLLNSIKKVLEILAFLFILVAFFGLIGNRLIGDLDGQVPYTQDNDFSSFGSAVNAIYVLCSSENYPTVMVPSLGPISLLLLINL
jgi:hypothetical protein